MQQSQTLNSAQQYAMLKPILRNPDVLSPTMQTLPTAAGGGAGGAGASLGRNHRRTKSATKIGKGARRGANQMNN